MSKEQDKELEEINNKKLKAKGAKVVEKQEAVNYQQVLIQVAQYLNDRGLEMMNLSGDVRRIIAGEIQRKNTARDIPDQHKV